MDSIRRSAQKCMEILEFVIPLLVPTINAPAEAIDIRIQLEALSKCINLFLSEAFLEDSTLSKFGSQ
jgi:hypothetical protein